MKLLTFSVFSAGWVASLHAATISANATGVDYSYTGYQSAFLLTDVSITNVSPGDPPISDGVNYYAFCIDFTKDSYWIENGSSAVVNLGISEAVDTVENSATWNATGQNVAEAVGQLGYLIDNYFIQKVENGDSVTRAAFAQVVWEITEDGGRGVGLDLLAGDYSRLGDADFAQGSQIMNEMEAMVADVISLADPVNYTWLSTNFIAKEDNLSNQDYILIESAITLPVPEPSSALLVSLAGLGLLANRRRS